MQVRKAGGTFFWARARTFFEENNDRARVFFEKNVSLILYWSVLVIYYNGTFNRSYDYLVEKY